MHNDTGAVLESKKDFEDTPQGQYNYYAAELKAALKLTEKWRKQSDKIVNRFLGKRTVQSITPAKGFDLNLFHNNVTTLSSMLYGNTPKVDVSRRYADPNDDIGRVAAAAMERLLNLDVADHGAEIDAVLRSTLQDRLLPGLGCARVRYEMETETIPSIVPGQPDEERLVNEDAPIEYTFWGDVLWGWARNFADLPWLAFRIYLTKDEIKQRFSHHAAENIQLKKQKMSSGDETDLDPNMNDPWMKGEIWEIWDKQKKKVCWVSLGYHKVLDSKPDPLKLSAFYPTPPFFLANATTSLYIPTPDFALAQDLYNEIDKLQERISIITEAVRVVGVYDASAEGIARMFREGLDNDLIPVDNWALFGEKQGIKGQVDWLPLAEIVNALDKLRELRSENIGLLQQVTGMSDVMRGGLDSAYEGVGQSEMKAKFGSIRVQALQDQFARFASDLMQIKAEVIARHFDPQTIATRCNLQNTPDAELLPQAIELIKNPDQARIRVAIRPESVAMVDYAQLKNERTDYINALSTFMQSAAPLMDQDPSAKPFLLQLLQWGLAGFKGASEIEGVIDKAIEASQEQAQQQPDKPDPEMMKLQAQQQLEQAKLQGQMQVIQAKLQADMQLRTQDEQSDIQTAIAQHQIKMAEIDADMQNKLAEIEAKMRADVMVEQVQAEANMAQTSQAAQSEVQKDALGTEMEIQKETAKTALKMQEISAAASAKIKEAKARPAPTTTGKKSSED